MKSLSLPTAFLALALLTVGCTHPADEEAAVPTREPDAPLLGEVSTDGHCDPNVVDIDHEKNTPHLEYHGFPGDHLHLAFVGNDGTTLREHDIDLPEGSTGHQAISSIYNGDIKHIAVDVTAPDRQAEHCIIPVA